AAVSAGRLPAQIAVFLARPLLRLRLRTVKRRTAMTSPMTRAELTEKLLGVKRENGWTWKHICAEIGGMWPVLITDGAGMLLFSLVVFSAENQAFSGTNKSCHPPS